ncbi:MAG: hypothetical protein JOY62_03105 [Acidobacteriaceae bacterium]|nr:hypothetical protein [Acidobacteriaceae bacterium]MBV9778938.1 hypothetical protein [Acidobacteriaceae bacterium]
MGSASFQFLAFALIVVIVHNLGRSVAWRQTILLVASLCFLATFSTNPLAYLPLVGFLAIGFLGVRAMQNGSTRLAFALLMCGTILIYIWLKKYTFIPEPLFLRFPYLTIGLSYIFFRVLHLIIDAHQNMLPERIGLISYLNYTLNFATLVSGPIQRYQDFERMQLAPVRLPLTAFISGAALERIVIGFFKVNVLSLLLSSVQQRALVTLTPNQPFPNRVLIGIVIAASYPLYLYCNFSGYIDIVIGIARFLRLELPENFNRPFSSDNFINFWSRWHITLSDWLKTYVYNPLAISLVRRFRSPQIEPFIGVLPLFVTFFLIGLWHGRTSEFIVYGVLLGLGVSVNRLWQVLIAKAIGRKRYRVLAADPIYIAFTRGLTFTWFTFTLLWFWSSWAQIGAMTRALQPTAIATVWLAIFLGATAVLAVYESLREWILSIELRDEPLLLSRYVRTVWDTALLTVSASVVAFLNAPAPDIVYKAF